MIEINLYQPGKINATIPFPSTWNELLAEELRLIAGMFLSTFENPSSIRAAILGGLLHIRNKKSKVKLPKNICQQLCPDDAVLNGYAALDFIFQENTLTEQPFQSFSLPGALWKGQYTVAGPSSDFNSLTCGEYEDAEIFFYKFKEEPTADSLAHIAAILYRPANTPYIKLVNGKKEEYKSEQLISRFMALPAWQLYTIFCWYSGCRFSLINLFPNTFQGGEGGEPDMMAFTKCIHAGAGPKNGSRDNIRMMPLKEYLYDIELEAIKLKELKKQQK